MSGERLSRRQNPLLRALKSLGMVLMVTLMGLARALGGAIRIEEPEERNRITKVEKKR